jgi:hypothetical protein
VEDEGTGGNSLSGDGRARLIRVESYPSLPGKAGDGPREKNSGLTHGYPVSGFPVQMKDSNSLSSRHHRPRVTLATGLRH